MGVGTCSAASARPPTRNPSDSLLQKTVTENCQHPVNRHLLPATTAAIGSPATAGTIHFRQKTQHKGESVDLFDSLVRMINDI